MGRGLDEKELRRRAIEGVRDEVEAFGSGAPDSRLIRRDGLLAAVVPASPQRSLFNSVFYSDPLVIAEDVEALQGVYEALGGEPPAPAGVGRGSIAPSACAELNDRAYGYGEDGFRAGLSGETAIRWHGAYAGETPVGCVGTIAVGDDCCVTGVATPPEQRGRGIASWLIWQALAEARESGLASASLQATRAGAPLYERIGFRDLGFIEMWEMRR